jgi:ABC-2 type transport system ATP-binding protein
VGFVSEDQVLPPGSSIAELIAFHRYLFPHWDEDLERQLLDRFALARGEKIKRLSKGQARQVALLCAVCHRPELLILDEPAGGLDPAARREFLETSIQLLNREGTAILFSSHHMSDVERIGGRIVLLDEGKVRLDRELDRLREEICVAMFPRTAADAAALVGGPGCLRVRQVFDDWHVVLEGEPEAVRARIKESLGIDGIRCVRMPLEELFIELVGGER